MKSIYIIIITVFIIGCSSFVYEELAHISKGMNIQEVTDVITNSDFGDGLELYNDDTSSDTYNVNNLTYFVAKKYSTIESEPYVFIFIDNTLVYWGLPYQIANSQNPKIRNTSPDITKTVQENYY